MRSRVDWYLHDSGQGGGCIEHEDPACLCDVDMSKAVEAICTPEFLLNVETVDDLLTAAAYMWTTVDIMPQIERMSLDVNHNDMRGRGRTPTLEGVNPQEVLDGILDPNRKVADVCKEQGENMIPARNMTFLYDVVGRANRRRTKPFPMEDVLQLGNEGYSAREIVKALYRKYGERWNDVTISKRYKEEAGVGLSGRSHAQRKRRAPQRQKKEERAAEVQARKAEAIRLRKQAAAWARDEGLTYYAISKRLMEAGHNINRSTVRRWFVVEKINEVYSDA